MKSIVTFSIFILSLATISAQEKVSSIENFLIPEQVHQESSLSYIHYNDADYAMYLDLDQLKLVDINDEDAGVLSYQIQLECFKVLETEMLSNLENKIYLSSGAIIQEINLDEPDEVKLFSFQTLTQPKALYIRNNYIVGYKDGIDDITIEIIDLTDFSTQVYAYEGYTRLAPFDNRLLVVSPKYDKLTELDITTGNLEVFHEGGGIMKAWNVGDNKNELVFRDSTEYFFSYNFETKVKDTICHFYGHQLDNYIFNSNNNIYYPGQFFTSFENFLYGINKEDCYTNESFQNFDLSNIPQTYSENGEDIILFQGSNSVIIYNETTDENFVHEVALGSTAKSIKVDNFVYVLGNVQDFSGKFRLSRFDMLTGDHLEILYDIPDIGIQFKIAMIDDNSLVILDEIEHLNSVIRLSLFNDDYEIRNMTASRDYGLIYNNYWNRHGTTISANLHQPEYRLLSLKDEQLTEVDLPDFKIGYYQWDDKIAGMSVQDDDLYFKIFDQSTQSVIEENYISSFANKERYSIVKIGDTYYEIINDRLYQRFPLNHIFPLFEEDEIYDVVFQSESEIVVILEDAQDIFSLARITTNGIEIIYSDLPKRHFKDIDVWVDNDHRLMLLFEDSENEETNIFSFDTQTGELLLNELYSGLVKRSYSVGEIHGWMTLEFEDADNQEFIVATNGKKVKKFEIGNLEVEPIYNFASQYINGYLFFTDEELGLVAVNEENLVIDISDDFGGIYRVHEGMLIDDTYYFIGSDDRAIMVFTSNLDFTELEQLYTTSLKYCSLNWKPQYLGNDVNGDILFTLETKNNGNEIWAINPESKEVNLYKDINGLPSSSIKSVEFLHEGIVYFKASDSTGIIQLYKLPVSFQPVNTTETVINPNEVGLYPNPVSSHLSLTIPLSSIVIKNISGIEVYKNSKIEVTSILDIQTLSTGIFILEGLDSDGLRYTQKFVKM